MKPRYIRPSWFTTHVWNRLVKLLTRLGFNIYGSRILAVRGRSSGRWRTTPVNVLTHQGERFLVTPRWVTQWVRNINAGGEAELRVGARHEVIRVVELTDDDKPGVLRAYLQRWKFEIGAFFQGVGPEATDKELRRVAPDYPVFRIQR